jgi:hypothetical protein
VSRAILWIVVGMIIMYLLSKILYTTGVTAGSSKKLKALLRTQQVANLIRTNEFREVVRTGEFRNYIGTLAAEEALSVATAMGGLTIKK